MMTMPDERTNAVIETWEFLQLLAASDDAASSADIREIAMRLLRHYPSDVDLDISAVALPGVWSPLAESLPVRAKSRSIRGLGGILKSDAATVGIEEMNPGVTDASEALAERPAR
ncbi:BPSL0761 family protein [Burkholderia vietnamiensis]|uniref:BPSL0761 family protein n=2 Tax=Burkholderia vietnamiensis TaxID=60552 RepID=UPI001ABA1522|nr:BPSL0761 family protein [Burkholderia vietnamiensis]